MLTTRSTPEQITAGIREIIGTTKDPLSTPEAELVRSDASLIFSDMIPRDPWSAGMDIEVFEWKYTVKNWRSERSGAIYIFQAVAAGSDWVEATHYASFSKRPLTAIEIQTLATLTVEGALPVEVDPNSRRLSSTEAAKWAGVAPSTWRSYVARGQAPTPDGHFDERTPWWEIATLKKWRPSK